MQTFNKLVRDQIPEIIVSEGRKCRIETFEPEEYQKALLEKLVEEAQEIASHNHPDELYSELADLYEVLNAVFEAFQIDHTKLAQRQQSRRNERGGFEKRIKLLWTD